MLRRAPPWRYTVGGCCRNGNASRSVNHVHQCLHVMTDRRCTLLTFITVATVSFLLHKHLQGMYLRHKRSEIIEDCPRALSANMEPFKATCTSEKTYLIIGSWKSRPPLFSLHKTIEPKRLIYVTHIRNPNGATLKTKRDSWLSIRRSYPKVVIKGNKIHFGCMKVQRLLWNVGEGVYR